MSARVTYRLAPPQFLGNGQTVTDVTVLFEGFPKKGTTRYNQPHLVIKRGDEVVHEEQAFFNGATYQADAVRVPLTGGQVTAWTHWAAGESRDGSSQEPTLAERTG